MNEEAGKNSTYNTHAAACVRFYDLTVNPDSVADFLFKNARCRSGEKTLFVGGMLGIAECLIARGLSLTFVDYSHEMVLEAEQRLPGISCRRADLRDLPFEEDFDLVLVVGRVFTHMLSDDDLSKALTACRISLRTGGRLFFDNYEDTKIRETNYFNGTVVAEDGETHIERESSTALKSSVPYIVEWTAKYSGRFCGAALEFQDRMLHRAFSRNEITSLASHEGLEVMAQGDNFDETSFFTLARRL